MNFDLVYGLLVPLLGTVLGAGLVFFARSSLPQRAASALGGFAAGVMVAASIWSLLLPAIERSSSLRSLAFFPAALGTLLGFAALLLLEGVFPHPAMTNEDPLQKVRMLVLSVTLHNLPEGMAVGVLIAARLAGDTSIPYSAVVSLASGIAIQNFPEGAIISLPMHSHGASRRFSFLLGVLSAIAEVVGAVLAILLTTLAGSLLPYFLAFSAGAMLFVVAEELIPEARAEGGHLGTVLFALGFCLMMVLDVMLG